LGLGAGQPLDFTAKMGVVCLDHLPPNERPEKPRVSRGCSISAQGLAITQSFQEVRKLEESSSVPRLGNFCSDSGSLQSCRLSRFNGAQLVQSFQEVQDVQ